MIKKELDPFLTGDKLAVAGRKAEERMAFYLRRFFNSAPHLFVLNGIRLEYDGDAAQIDHLILHPYGVFVVESKSVAGKIQIKDDGQWIRWYGKESTGMASPVTQAKLQLRFMRDYLDRAVTPKGAFNQLAFDILVSISDSGIILWPTSGESSDVCKADQVAERIESRIAHLEKQQDTLKPLKIEQLEKLADFLCSSHKPLQLRTEESFSSRYQEASFEKQIETAQKIMAMASQSASVIFSNIMAAQQASVQPDTNIKHATKKPHTEPVNQDSQNRCHHCSSTDISILFGHNYYFHCNACNKNTPLRPTCANCGQAETPRKKGKEFFLECPSCNTYRLFHING